MVLLLYFLPCPREAVLPLILSGESSELQSDSIIWQKLDREFCLMHSSEWLHGDNFYLHLCCNELNQWSEDDDLYLFAKSQNNSGLCGMSTWDIYCAVD